MTIAAALRIAPAMVRLSNIGTLKVVQQRHPKGKRLNTHHMVGTCIRSSGLTAHHLGPHDSAVSEHALTAQ